MSLCCNTHQIDVIVAVCAYTVLILGTWRVDAVVKPFNGMARHFSGLVGGRRLLPRAARWGPPRFLRARVDGVAATARY